MAGISAVCLSGKRQTRKAKQDSILLIENFGIENDAHAGSGSRQVSILSELSLARMEAEGIRTSPGCCGENIDICGAVELHTLLPGVQLKLGESAVVSVTEIGKDNSDGHADNVIRGNIFPIEGVFAEVLAGGTVKPDDPVEVLRNRGFTAGVLTVSDSASRGDYQDRSGTALLELLNSNEFLPVRYAVVPDEVPEISAKLRSWCDDGFLDVLFTTGGTGFSMRDVTPEATDMICEREVPGIPEMIRQKSALIVESAWLSRARAGIRKRTLVINLPGSRKAAVECAGFAIPILGHALEVLRGDIKHCGHGDVPHFLN
ncbi:MAG: molybdenum cofactor synthesis domain-containing protein [Candidatus Fermentibacteria bacterium]